MSRETLQANKFIKQLRNIIIRKALDLFTRMANDDEENFKKFSTVYGSALRVGILESSSKKDQNKLASLLRVSSTRSDFTSFDEVSLASEPPSRNSKELSSTLAGSMSRTVEAIKSKSSTSRALENRLKPSPDLL